MKTDAIAKLYDALAGVEGAEAIITRAVTACADVLSEAAANEPDTRMQRRVVLGNAAFELRVTTHGHHDDPSTHWRKDDENPVQE